MSKKAIAIIVLILSIADLVLQGILLGKALKED